MKLPKFSTLALAIAALVAVTLSACDSSTAPREQSLVSKLVISFDTSKIVAPDTVTRGVPFMVSFTTFGGGCVRRVDRTDVRITGMVAELRPYDVRTTYAGSSVCTSDLMFLKHQATVQFATPGRAALLLIGERGIGDVSVPYVVERLIVVK